MSRSPSGRNETAIPSVPVAAPALHPRDVLRRLQLSPRKSMGQNFLVSEDILAEIVACTGVGIEDTVLEIGPGLGALTRHLKAAGARVIALEKDRGYAAYLKERFQDDPQVEIVQGDALEWDLGQLPGDRERTRVVANLPYNVAVPILFRLLEPPVRFRDLYVMVQKEVADRMTASASTGAYGALTVNLGVLATVTPVIEVPRGAFYPPPKVTSAVVRIEPRSAPPYPLGSAQVFQRVVRAAFGERRKTLRNALAALFGRETASRVLEAAGIDPMRRGETLDLEEFCRLSVAFTAPGPGPGT